MTPQSSYRYLSQALLVPHPNLSPPLALPGQPNANHPQADNTTFLQEAANIGWERRVAIITSLLSCKEKMNEQGGVGHQIPTDFRVESVQLKCILPERSSSLSTESPLSPPKLLLPTAQQVATKQTVVMEPECGVLALPTAPETLLCLPTLPLFKNKTKSPTPPSVLQHPRHRARTDGGGRTLHMPTM